MTFHIITIFPEAIKSYFDSSILGRAQKSGLINVKFYNPRDYTEDKHKKVDDSPFGGGAGMVMKLEPIVRTIKSIISNNNSKFKNQNAKLQFKNENFKNKGINIILFSPIGKQFTHKIAKKIAKEEGDVIFICGRYEGIDARLADALRDLGKTFKNRKFKIENYSIGPYILTGGELPAAVIIDTVSRHIPGVLGKSESLELVRRKGGDIKNAGIPVYTRPEVFEFNKKKYKVPKVLLSGDHKKIEKWKAERGEVWG